MLPQRPGVPVKVPFRPFGAADVGQHHQRGRAQQRQRQRYKTEQPRHRPQVGQRKGDHRSGKGRDLPLVAAGDLVAFRSAGAYGAVMASEYNTRPLIPEVLVNGDHFAVIRARPSFDEILNRDTIPEWL